MNSNFWQPSPWCMWLILMKGRPMRHYLSLCAIRAQAEGAVLVSLCTKLEAEIVQLPSEERDEYYQSAGITSPGWRVWPRLAKNCSNSFVFLPQARRKRVRAYPSGDASCQGCRENPYRYWTRVYPCWDYKYDDLKRLGTYKAVQEKIWSPSRAKSILCRMGMPPTFVLVFKILWQTNWSNNSMNLPIGWPA